MAQYDNDRHLLVEALKNLPKEDLANLLQEVDDNKTQMAGAHHANNEKVKHPESNANISSEDLRERWIQLKKEKSNGNKFLELMDDYIESYLSKESGPQGSHSRAAMENWVSNHSKWHRMMNHRGQGRQYKDDLRRICFLFHLSYPEANELLWSAGHFFDYDDFRDFIIIDCLQKQEYSFERIDALLNKHNLSPLFPSPKSKAKDESSPLRHHNK